MYRRVVASSNLLSVGYDSSTNVLEVEFCHGGVYQYAAVPRGVYEGLMNAESHGKFFDLHVKKAGYVATRISG